MDITVNGYEISPPVVSGVTKGSYKNERLNFIFDASWNNLVKTVTFYTPKREVVCLVTEEGMPIPDEVINTIGVTRYVICGTDGLRTVVTAEGAINVKSSLAVDLGSFEGRSPGVVEQITTYLKHSVDAYENAYDVASNVASSAASAQNAKNAAQEAQLLASEMKNEAENSAKKCEAWAEKAGRSDENLNIYMKNHKLPLVLYKNSLIDSPRPGVMYFKKKKENCTENNFEKSVFLCQEGVPHYGWKCDELIVYTLSENPETSDAVYTKDSFYTVKQSGFVTFADDGVINVLIDEAEYKCYRMSATDTEFGVYGWERIKEVRPVRMIKTFDIETESIKAIATEDDYGDNLNLNEFYIRILLKKSPNATTHSDMAILVNNYETGATVPYSAVEERVLLFHGVCMGDGVLVERIPLSADDASEASCVIKALECPINSLGVRSTLTNRIGAGSKVEIWGVDY